VGGDGIHLAVASRRVHEAEFAKHVGLRYGSKRACVGIENFKACHLPLLSLFESPAVPSGSLVPWLEGCREGLKPPLSGVVNSRQTKPKQLVNLGIH
jgi:hypothetical protein